MEEPRGGREAVLVVDDDIDIARYVELNLSLEGFGVHVAHDGEEAVRKALVLRPEVVLLDVMMPGLDGYEVCRRIRSDARTSHAAVIMLTAKTLSADTVLGLTAGADDYIAKPFDPPELVARVRAALRRARQLRDVSPLTGLPGNSEIARRVDDLISSGTPFALVHADLDRFKAFNDRYGFARGDDAIRATGEVLAQTVTAVASDVCFIGHIGGDDFVLIVAPEAAEQLCQLVVQRFDELAPSFYDAADAEQGFIEVDDRRNHRHRVGIMTISLGVATTAHRPLASLAEASAIATEMKLAAKQERSSAYRIDQRRV
ncbi:MAG TPA: response regulator [Acidimicrobiales bacterium]|jgi:diguanylate cyclase (GGDEF)-like protein|nr:response regulator [Acidimicrobiales bacterium]